MLWMSGTEQFLISERGRKDRAMRYEGMARNSHKSGMNCAMATYTALGGDRKNAPKPRAEGGKCGAVLAAEQAIRERGISDPEEFDREFLSLFGSMKCAELRGIFAGKCNDYVGTAARLAGGKIQ